MGIFCEAKNKGFLFWDATRIMQNIQDVENSKKILPQKDKMMLSTIDTNLDLGLERYRDGDVDDDESTEINMEKNNENQSFDDENLDLIMEEYEMQDGHNGLLYNLIKENDCGSLSKEMKEHYIIDDPIITDADVMISECELGLDVQIEFETDNFSSNSSNNAIYVIKVILNLD
jgi:hypothetical protein